MKGITYIHEHLRIDLSKIKNDIDCDLNCFSETLEEMKVLKSKGVDNLCEVTNIGMGRDVEFMSKIAEESGINVIMSTGFYKAPFLPEIFYEKTEDELTDLLVSDLTKGMDGTDLKATIIGEVGSSLSKITDDEEKLLRVAISAHKKTDAVISTHTSLGTMAKEQGDIFLKAGVDPERVYLGHCDLSKSLDTIKEMINKGFYVGFDTVGKKEYFEDEKRCEILKELQNLGLLSKVMLSMDITRRSHLGVNGGLSYSYLLDTFVKMAESYGITDKSIEQMLVLNPKKFLSLQ